MTMLHQRDHVLLDHMITNPRIINSVHIPDAQISVHVALIVKRGKIIAEATNTYGSRSRGSGYSNRSIHAEINAIKQLGNIHEMRGADMYVGRISRDAAKEGECKFSRSRPCPVCSVILEKCMREYGLRNIYHT